MPHFWEYCVGSGHATLALRADWQSQLKQCREQLGFQHVRFHGLLNDDMNTVIDQDDDLLYSFHNADQIYDFLRSIDMRPFIELSFMPSALASGEQTTFHYKANVTPPKDYDQWATLVSKAASHWIDRYGANEVSMWPMEVWNEPNMASFWTGSQEDYFRLFETTYHALKHVHPDLKIGGPATAQNAWIDEFLIYCNRAGVEPDFISTHTYPTDARGNPDDDTKDTLSKSHFGVLRERAQEVRKQAGSRPLYYTEWSTSSNPRDELHDEPYAAAYITQAMLNMGTLVDAYSYWTFSDIFEENYFPSKPFQGGFGLLTIHGIPKPAYRAFELLHRLGDEKLTVKGHHDTVQAWVIRGENMATVVIVNLALPAHSIKAESINVELFGLPEVASAEIRRIDGRHANAKSTWKRQGEPRYPNPDEVASMMEASCMKPEPVKIRGGRKAETIEIEVQPQSVTAVELQFAVSKNLPSSEQKPREPYRFAPHDETLLDTLQANAFRYFTEYAAPENGLVADSSKPGSAASIAATGFALSCYPVAAERGWLSRKKAAEIVQTTLRFFAESRQGADAHATGYKGFYYHFLNMKSGERANACELSTIDTTMLMAGIIGASEYFNRQTAIEKNIRTLARELFERVEWNWTVDDDGEINQSWKPGQGFKKADWEGYTEALTMYVLGASSTSYPLPAAAYKKDASQYPWHYNAGLNWIHAAPLFIHLFPQAWMDLRGLHDGFVNKHFDMDYYENTRRAITVQRHYGHFNPNNYTGYNKDIWGLSACAGPDGERLLRNGNSQTCLGYAARGVTRGPDDGTLVPWASAACLAHAPEVALAGIHAMLNSYPRALRDGQFVGAINPSLPGEGPEGWISPACFGIDQGLVVMMIENARSGLIWDLTRKAPRFKKGMLELGFRGSWLE